MARVGARYVHAPASAPLWSGRATLGWPASLVSSRLAAAAGRQYWARRAHDTMQPVDMAMRSLVGYVRATPVCLSVRPSRSIGWRVRATTIYSIGFCFSLLCGCGGKGGKGVPTSRPPLVSTLAAAAKAEGERNISGRTNKLHSAALWPPTTTTQPQELPGLSCRIWLGQDEITYSAGDAPLCRCSPELRVAPPLRRLHAASLARLAAREHRANSSHSSAAFHLPPAARQTSAAFGRETSANLRGEAAGRRHNLARALESQPASQPGNLLAN